LQAQLRRCIGLTVLARRGDTYRQAEFVKVRSNGEVSKQDAERVIGWQIELYIHI